MKKITTDIQYDPKFFKNIYEYIQETSINECKKRYEDLKEIIGLDENDEEYHELKKVEKQLNNLSKSWENLSKEEFNKFVMSLIQYSVDFLSVLDGGGYWDFEQCIECFIEENKEKLDYKIINDNINNIIKKKREKKIEKKIEKMKELYMRGDNLKLGELTLLREIIGVLSSYGIDYESILTELTSNKIL